MARILFVEDDEAVLDVFERTFTRAGHQVLRARCRTHALRALAHAPDLAVLDVGLERGPEPEHDGFDVCRALREAGYGGPVIFLSGHRSDEDLLVGFELGADDWIHKPCSLGELTARVEAVLRRHGADPSLYQLLDARPAPPPPVAPSPASLDVAELAHRVLAAAERLHPAVRLTGTLPSELPAAGHLQDPLLQVLSLLVSEGARQAGGDGHVHLTVREQGGAVEVSVAWHPRGRGPGRPSGASGSSPEGGSGLTIVRYIVEARAGRTSVESTLAGGGTYRVILPLGAPDAAGG